MQRSFVLALTLTVSASIMAHANGLADDWINKNCKQLSVLGADATPTQVRDALATCKEILAEQAKLVQTQMELVKMERELASVAAGETKKAKTGAAGQNKLDIEKMLSSDDVFLIAVGGFVTNATAQLFYKGRNYWLRPGDRFPGGELVAIGNGRAQVKRANGKTVWLSPVTLDEIKTQLGIAAPDKTSAPNMAVPIYPMPGAAK
ncbi:MAG: hypothetical protein D6712_18235 [Chloroflexi bacterium]|nr:MAG: hypothetical protein D6712_18235 [Chloroflexota bacterium]